MMYIVRQICLFLVMPPLDPAGIKVPRPHYRLAFYVCHTYHETIPLPSKILDLPLGFLGIELPILHSSLKMMDRLLVDLLLLSA